MNRKSKTGKQKKIFILGSSTALIIGTIATGLSVGTGVESYPQGITGKSDYFTTAKNAEVDKVITQLGLTKNNFLEGAQNNAFQLINSYKQFDVINSDVTIDQLISRVQALDSIGIYTIDASNNISRRSLQPEIDHLLKIKKDAEDQASKADVINAYYKAIAARTRQSYIDAVPLTDAPGRENDIKRFQRTQNINYNIIKQLYALNPELFREFMYDYVKTWISLSENGGIVNNPNLGITLAKVNTANRNNIDYVAGSKYIHADAESWNTERGTRVFQTQDLGNGRTIKSYRFTSRGTIIFNDSSNNHKDVVFVKENLTPADFMLFQLFAAGQFNDAAEAKKLTQPYDGNGDGIRINVEPGDWDEAQIYILKQGLKPITRPISKFLNHAENTDKARLAVFNEFQREYFNQALYHQLIGKTFQVNGAGTRFTYNDTLNNNRLPDPGTYLARATYSIETFRANTFIPYEQEARKYFIEKFYAGTDTGNLNIDNLPTDSATKTRLKKFPKETSLYTAANQTYGIINKASLVSHRGTGTSSSLSFKWFVANRYNENGNPFTFVSLDQIPGYARSSMADWRFSPTFHADYVHSDKAADDAFKNASDRMIYDYIQYVSEKNNFNLQDQTSKEIFKNVYRFIRSVVSFETDWSAAQKAGGADSVVLNGYNQHSDRQAFSELLTVTSSMVAKYYDELVQSVQSAVTEAIAEYAKNPTQNQLNTILNIFNFYQNYINPSQIDVDSTRRWSTDTHFYSGPNATGPINNYLSLNFPNFGVAKLNSSGNATNTDTLTGRAPAYYVVGKEDTTRTFVHYDMWEIYKSRFGKRDSEADFKEYVKYFFNTFLRDWNTRIALNATPATGSTNELDKINIGGSDFTINPQYAFGKVLGAIEFTNAAVLSPRMGSVDQISIDEFGHLGINYTRYLQLGLDGSFNTNKDINDTNRPVLTKEYFNRINYTNYLNDAQRYKSRVRANPRTAPLSPVVTSTLYGGNYKAYADDYNSYISTFYTSEARTELKPGFPLPVAPSIYTTPSTINTTAYFNNFSTYLETLKKYYATEREKRNIALKKIGTINLNTQEDTSYIVTLRDGQQITTKEGWFDANRHTKVTDSNPIAKIQIGNRKIVIPENSPYIIWRIPQQHMAGIEKILPGPNAITNDPKDLTERVTTRNLLIKQLDEKAIQNYRNLYTEISSWYSSIRNDLNPNDAIEFNKQIVALSHNTGTLSQVDGYTITHQDGIMDADSRFPWDTASQGSYNLQSTSYFSKIFDFVNSVKAARTNNLNTLAKPRELTLLLIKDALKDDSTYNGALTNLNDLLAGRKVVNASGQLVDSTSSTPVPLSRNFPQSASNATQAISAVDALRRYSKNEAGYTFSNYNNTLLSVSDPEYRNALSTVSLIYEFQKFNQRTFPYGASSAVQNITKDQWGYSELFPSGDQLTNDSAYQTYVDSRTTANTAFRYFAKTFSPADSDSALFIPDRDRVVNSLQDLYTTIGSTVALGAASYNPSSNPAQNAIDATNSGLTGDIAHIIPDQRAGLATKYFDAIVALDRIKIQAANLTALRKTKVALNFAYTNAEISVSKVNRVGSLVVRGFWPHFSYHNGNATVGTTRTSENEAVMKINDAINSINALDPYAAIAVNKEDYLTAMDVMSELLHVEQSLVITPDTQFSREKFITLDQQLVQISEKLDAGFTSKPWYSDITDSTQPRRFAGIKNPQLRNIILRKIRYLQYLGGAFFIKDNYVPEFDWNNGNIDPTTNLPEWNKFALKITQQGHSSVNFRQLPKSTQDNLIALMKAIYPVIRYPNDPTVESTEASVTVTPRPDSYVEGKFPTLETVNNLRSALTILSNPKNDSSLLQSEYEKAKALAPSLVSGSNPTSPAAKLLISVIAQTKDFLDIQNANTNSNTHFNGIPAITNKNNVVDKTFNEFSNADISNQLLKLQNAIAIYNIVNDIRNFRNQYTTIGINGLQNNRPQDLKPRVNAAVYAAFEAEDTKAANLLSSGTIPSYSNSFDQLNNSVNTAVNLAPGVDASSALIPVTFAGNQLINDFSTIRSQLNTLRNDLFVKTNALTNTISDNQLIPLLNELNGNPTVVRNGSNIFNTTANTHNPNNIVYAVNPSEWTTKRYDVPAVATDTTNTPATLSLRKFNENFGVLNAFPQAERNKYNGFPYQDFLESKTAEKRGPTSLKKDASTSQTDFNTLVSYLNTQMTTQVMNAIYWANTDYIVLNKMREFLLANKNSTEELSNGTFVQTRAKRFDEAYYDTRDYFTNELAKGNNSKYIAVDGYNPNQNLGGRIPLLKITLKMFGAHSDGYGQDQKTIMIRLYNSSDALQTAFRNQGFILAALTRLGAATDTSSRESYIQSYQNYLNARSALNGVTTEISKDGSTDTVDAQYSRITSLIDHDWETRTYFRPNDINLRNWLRRAKVLINENNTNYFIKKEDADDVLTNLKLAYAAKLDADNSTRVEVVSRLPEIARRVTEILGSNALSYGQKATQIDAQINTLADAIGVKKGVNTGMFNTTNKHYVFATFGDDAANTTGIIKTFMTLDPQLVKVAHTYSKTLQSLDFISSFMKLLDSAQRDPNVKYSNLFANYVSDFGSVLSQNSPFVEAEKATPTLQTNVTDKTGKKSIASSTTDIRVLNDLISAVKVLKTQMTTASTNIKTIVDGFVTTREALDKLLKDGSVVYEDGRVFSTREPLIKDAKAKFDKMYASNDAHLINPEPFNNYRDQLAKYFKTLLTLDKTRNIFYIVLDTTVPNVHSDPSNGITKVDIDSLYNQYIAFMQKFSSLNSNMSAKSLYDIAKKELLDPTKRATALAIAKKWLIKLDTSIDEINVTNPNAVSNDNIALARRLYEKVSSGFTFLFDYFQYLDANFVANPTTNVGKVEVPVNVGFELDSGIRNYKRGTDGISSTTFTSLSNAIKQLIAFNGLFRISGTVDNNKLGAISLLLKNPSREGILQAVTLANTIKTQTLPQFQAALGQIPAELKKVEGLVSFSLDQSWQDLINATKINLLKFNLISKLNNYLFSTTDAAKTELTNELNTVTSQENKKVLSNFLPTNATPDAKAFKDHYLEGLKSLVEKILKIGDQFNNIDKLVIGKPDPLDTSTTVTATNIDSIRNKYLNVASLMVDGTEDPTEISNLTKEIPTDVVRNFILSEIGIQHIKDTIKLKIQRKRFEITISILKDLPLASFNDQNETVKATKVGLASSTQASYLKAFATLILAQKTLEVAFHNYVQNIGSVTVPQLVAFQRTFLDARTAFTNLASQKSTFALSEQKLYDDVKTNSDIAFAESEAVLSLQQFVLDPSGANGRDLKAKFDAIQKVSLDKPIFANFISPAKALADKVFAYWNNEKDFSGSKSSENNTVTNANDLYKEIEAKTHVAEGQKPSPYFTELLSTMNVLRSDILAQKDIDNLLEFNSRAKSGPSFNPKTGTIFDKTTVPATIQSGNLRIVDSNGTLLANNPRRQSLALRELLNVVSAIQLSTDLINADNGQFNYVGNPASLSSARSAYTRIKEVYDRFVVNPSNWQTLVLNNSSARLKAFANEILEKVKLLNQLAKVTFLFSASTNLIDGTDRDLIPNGDTYYNAFVKEYTILKAMFAKDVRPQGTPASATETRKLAQGDTDYWRAFNNMFAFINMLHKDDKSGALDLLNTFLSSNINDAAKQKAAENAAIKVFDDVIPNRVPNSSFSAVGTLMRAQLSKTNVIVKITSNLRNYYEALMEEGYRKYLGTYNAEIQARIEASLKAVTDQFGTSNSKPIPGDPTAEGNAWIGEIPLALGSVQTRVDRLKSAFRSVQKYIDAILALQLVVDQYVKEPTEENRAKAINSTLWQNLETHFAEVQKLAVTKADDTIPENLVNFAADLVKLKDVQKNKMRLVQGLMVASLAPDLTRLDFENIANPYEDEKGILGNTFNLYNALGVTPSLTTGDLEFSPIANSLFFSANHFPLSSDAIVLQLLGLINPDSKIESVSFTSLTGTSVKTPELNVIFPNKDSSYLQVFAKVQAAYKKYLDADLYKAASAEKLEEFNKSVFALVNRVKMLNLNKTQIDTDKNALYNGVEVKLGATNPRADINFEQHIYNFSLFLSEQVAYDNAVKAFVQNPIDSTFAALQTARQNLEAARVHVFDVRTSVAKTTEAQLDDTLNRLNEARISFDEFKASPSQTNLIALTQKTSQFQASLGALVPLKNNLVAAKQIFIDNLQVKSKSFDLQISLIRAINNYVITLTDVNKKTVEENIAKLREIPQSVVAGSQEFILLNQVETVKALADKILPLEKAYHAIDNFSGVLTDRLLKSAIEDFETITTNNPDNPLIKALLNRIQIPLKTIQANRNIDKQLSEFASTLTDASKAKLDQTIADSKALIKQITISEAQSDQLSAADINTVSTLLENSIPSYITLQYIKAANEEFKTFKLFEQYKLNASEELKNQINRQVLRTALLNDSAKYLSQLIAHLSDSTIVVDNSFVTEATQYDSKQLADNGFGKNTLAEITDLITKLTAQKPNIDNTFRSTQNTLQATITSTTASPQQLEIAKKAFNDANYNRKSFNNLTSPFTSGQKLINPLITLRINAIVSQLNVVDSLKLYVDQQSPYAKAVYASGKKLVQNRDEQERLTVLINRDKARIEELKKVIGTSSDSPVLRTVASLTQRVKQNEELLKNINTQQTVILSELDTALNSATSDQTLLNNAKNNAQTLLASGKKIDAEALKAGNTELSRETKLATQALNTIEIYTDLKQVLTDYFKNQLKFVSDDHDKIARYIKNFEQMRSDVTVILPQSIFDVISESWLPFVNDFNTYIANSNFILNANADNRTKAVNLNNTNKTIGDIVDAVNLLSAYNAAVNNLKTNLTAANVEEAKKAQVAFETRALALLEQSFQTNNDLTSLTSLIKNNVFTKILSMIKAKLAIFEALNSYLSNPNAAHATALIAAKTSANTIKILTNAEQKILVNVEMVKEINDLGTIIDAVTNDKKTGLGDEVEKLIIKAAKDASTITIDEISTLKTKLITGNKLAPFNIIKARLVVVLDKLQADRRTALLVKDLKDAGNNKSDLSITYDKDPKTFINKDTKDIKENRDKQTSLLDKTILALSPNTVKTIEDAEARIKAIEVKEDTDRTTEEVAELIKLKALVAETKVAKDEYDAKKAIVDATTKELETAKNELKSLTTEARKNITEKEKEDEKAALGKVISLTRTLREKLDAKAANDLAIKEIADKRVLILTPSEKSDLDRLKRDLARTLEPALIGANNNVKSTKARLEKLIKDKAKKVLNEAQLKSLNDKEASLPALEKALSDAQNELAKNAADQNIIVEANVPKILNPNENRDYIDNKIAVAKLNTRKVRLDAQLDTLNAQITELNNKGAGNLTSGEKEKLVELQVLKTALDKEIAKNNNLLSVAEIKVKTVVDRVIEALPTADKAKHAALVANVATINAKIEKARNDFNARVLEINSEKAPVISAFTPEEKADYDKGLAAISDAQKARDLAKRNADNAKAEINALSNKVNNSLTSAERITLNNLLSKVPELTKEVADAKKAFDDNNAVISDIENKALATLNASDAQRLTDLKTTIIPTIEDKLSTQKDAETVALNHLTLTDISNKKVAADKLVVDKNAQITAKETEVANALLDTTTEGVKKSDALKAELAKLKEELAPLVTNATKLASDKLDAESLIAERAKVTENADKLLAENKAQLDKLKALPAANVPPLSKVVSIIATDASKESTAAALNAGVSEAEAKKSEILVKAISDQNNLDAAKKEYNNNPTFENSTAWVKAIEAAKASSTALSGIDLNSLSTTLKASADVIINESKKAKFENNIVDSANKAFEDATPNNKAALEGFILDAKAELNAATAELATANAMADGDAKKAAVAKATSRLKNAQDAVDVANKFDRYSGVLKALEDARSNIDKDPKTTDATLKPIEDSLSTFGEDDADPILKLARDATRKQIADLKVAIGVEKTKVALDAAAKEYIGKPNNDEFSKLVKSLSEATANKTPNAIAYNKDLETTLKTVEGAIKAYDNSDVTKPESLAEATKELNNAKAALNSVVSSADASQASKDLASAIIKNVDSLLANINSASSNESEMRRKLDDAITLYTINSNAQNLETLNKAIQDAKNARINVKGVEGLLKLQNQIGDLDKLVAKLKVNIFDSESQNQLNTGLENAKAELNAIKALVQNDAAVKKLADEIETKINNINIDNQLFNGDAEGREISRRVDALNANMDATQNPTSQQDVETLKATILSLPAASDTQKAVRVALIEKVQRTENELSARNLLSTIGATPSADQITALTKAVNGSFGQYYPALNAIVQGSTLREELQKFRASTSGDNSTIDAMIAALINLSNSTLTNAQNLVNSPNNTIKKYATESLDSFKFTHDSVDAETTLYEGIRDINQQKIDKAHQLFEKLYAKMGSENSTQYKKLFDKLGKWQETVKLAKEGNIRAIMDINNIEKEVKGLKDVANISLSGIATEAQKYILSQSSQWKTTIGALSASVVAGVVSAALFFLLRRRRKSKKQKI